MTVSKRKASSDQLQAGRSDAEDPVLSALREAEAQYRAVHRGLRQENQLARQELARAQQELAHARQDNADLDRKLVAQSREIEEERRRAQHRDQTAETFGNALKELLRSASSGNVFDLILKTCLSLTGATRGLYVTIAGPSAPARVRAAVDVDDYPSSEPSSFITSLCRVALENEGVSACNDFSLWPEQPAQGEAFRNCVAAPVVLRNDLSGVVIVADKVAGDFDEDDADVLLSVGSQAAVVIENTRLQREVQDAYLSIVRVLAETMAARYQQAPQDLETGARRARKVAERLGLSEHERSVVFYAALLHDIGNTGVSDGVLNKPGPLTDAERELIRSHAQIGHDLLRQVPLFDEVAAVVRHHHERFDGSGYPDGFTGDGIPIAARIIAVVDAYSAMLATRSYRPALTSEAACEQLQQGAGTQFDPRVVEAFLAVVDVVATQRSADDPGELVLPGIDATRTAANLVAR